MMTMIVAGLTFDEIGKAINRDEVYVAAAFYGQARITFEADARLVLTRSFVP
jgi:cyanate lyase